MTHLSLGVQPAVYAHHTAQGALGAPAATGGASIMLNLITILIMLMRRPCTWSCAPLRISIIR